MKKLLFKIARSDISRFFMGFAFEHLSHLMPLDRLVDTPNTLVFKHPVPQSEIHLLAVPQKALPNFASINLNDTIHREHIKDIFKSIQVASSQSKLQTYAVLINGGAYQDVPQLHCHIMSGKNKDGSNPIYLLYETPIKLNSHDETDTVMIENSPRFREFHKVIHSMDLTGSLQTIDFDDLKTFSTICMLLEAVQDIIQKSALDRYTVLMVHQPTEAQSYFTIHVISGVSK